MGVPEFLKNRLWAVLITAGDTALRALFTAAATAHQTLNASWTENPLKPNDKMKH